MLILFYTYLHLEHASDKIRNKEDRELYSGTFVLYVTEPWNLNVNFDHKRKENSDIARRTKVR